MRENWKYWLPVLIAVPVAMLVNLASPALGAPVVIAISVLWFLMLIAISVYPIFRKWRAERTRKGREQEFYRLIQEAQTITMLRANQALLTAYAWNLFWGFVGTVSSIIAFIIFVVLVYSLINGGLVHHPTQDYDPFIVTAVLLSFSLSPLGNRIRAQERFMRRVYHYDDYIKENHQALAKLYAIDRVNYLYIISARFGTDTVYVDITDYLRSMIIQNKVVWPVAVNPFAFKDPAPGQPKTLVVDYMYGLTPGRCEVREDEKLNLPDTQSSS